ncbi:MAG: tat (twin-arginine translocation) pathway signal sequence, partial [bacterium]
MKKISRREFIIKSSTFAGVVAAGSLPIKPIISAAKAGQPTSTTPSTKSIIAVAQKGAPAELTKRAVKSIGGIGKYVKKGDIVLVKPNIGWDRRPEQAA